MMDGDRTVSLRRGPGEHGRTRLVTALGTAEIDPRRRWTFIGRPQQGHDPGWTAFGGLLPAGALTTELVFDSGARIHAKVGHGGWVATRADVSDADPKVLYRDAGGRPVYVRDRPVPDQRHELEDVMEPCPVCSEVHWQEHVSVKATSGGAIHEGVCGACGFGFFMGPGAGTKPPDDRGGDREPRAGANRAALAHSSWRAIDLDVAWTGRREIRAGLNRDGVLTDVTLRRGELGAPGGLISLTTSYDAEGGAFSVIFGAGGGVVRRCPAVNSQLPHLDLRRRLEDRRVGQCRKFGNRGVIEVALKGTRIRLDYSEHGKTWLAEGSDDGLELMIAGFGVSPNGLELREVDNLAAIPEAEGSLRRDETATPSGIITPEIPDGRQTAPSPAATVEPLTLVEVRSLLSAAGFGEDSDRILASARSGFRLKRIDVRGQAATSRVGGHPGLAVDEVWPHGPSGTQMTFVAQIDLATLPPLPDDWPKPLSWRREPGVLRFFADLLSVRGEPVRARLMLAPPGSELTITTPPQIPDPLPYDPPYRDEELVEELIEIPERNVTLTPFLTLPEIVPGIKDHRDDFSETAQRYSEVAATVRAGSRPVTSWTQVARSHLLGEPLAIQHDPREAGPWAHEGLDLPDTSSAVDGWCALLAIHIDMNIDINDGGAYTFILPAADLAAGRYDRTVCDQQSG